MDTWIFKNFLYKGVEYNTQDTLMITKKHGYQNTLTKIYKIRILWLKEDII